MAARFATYAQRIKNKSGSARKPTSRPAAKAPAVAAAKTVPAEAPPPAAPPSASGELQRLKDDLQRVNLEISKIARETRGGPDAARHSQLPEKQQLHGPEPDHQSKIRARP